ncbi:MAG: STAS domain-containing protein [Solirubrobacteraceae bacterium]
MTPPGYRVEVVPSAFEARILDGGSRGVRVVVSGELDLAAAPQLDGVLTRALASAEDIIIDLAAVRFIDSTGLYTIVGALREADSSGVTLRVRSTLHPQVARLFEVVGMAHILPFIEI